MLELQKNDIRNCINYPMILKQTNNLLASVSLHVQCVNDWKVLLLELEDLLRRARMPEEDKNMRH